MFLELKAYMEIIGYVIVYNFSRITWIFFLACKSEAYNAFDKLANMSQNSLSLKITSIRIFHKGEFVSHSFQKFCIEIRIDHNSSAPHTPQQNVVVEINIRGLEELGRTLIVLVKK